MLPIQSEYYGDNHRWFIATVIDHIPPLGLEGKVKIHIDGIHSTDTNDIPHKDLPWAQVMLPTNTGGASGHGEIPQLVAGSRVVGMFMDGKHSQLPLVMGHMHSTEFPNDNQYKNILIPEEPYETIDYRKIAAKYFLNIGYRPHIAATITGAAEQLTSLDPLYNKDGKFGIMRWNKNTNRYTSLVTFAKDFDQRYDHYDIVTQLAFVANELRTTRSEVVGHLRKTYQIKDNPVRTRSRQISGLGSASVMVTYFDKVDQSEIIDKHLSAIRGVSRNILEILNA